MSSKVDDRYYIACQDIRLQREFWLEFKYVLSSQSPFALKGDLLVIEGDDTGDIVHGTVAFDPTKKIKCLRSSVAYVTRTEFRILAPIKIPSDRWELFKDKQRMEMITGLRVDEHVWVTVPVEQESQSGLISTGCLRGTIRYFGEIGKEIGTYFGIELQEPKGICDGSFREYRYFMCKDKHGIFLPASHLIPSIKSKQTSSEAPLAKILVPLALSRSGQKFCLNDKVFVFDKDGNRISGRVKWAYRQHKISDFYVIGIETDSSNTHHSRFPEHLRGLSHYFSEHDYKSHSYLALPETVVLKDEPEASVSGPSNVDVKDPVHERDQYRQLMDEHQQLQEDQRKLKLGQKELEIDNQQIKEDYQELIGEHRQLQEANKAIQTMLEKTTATLQTAMQKITQLEKTVFDMQPSWSINPTELQITDECIGRGGWGEVKTGLYHGTKVAVKVMYEVIVSDYNRVTFQREMRIASLVRHPNLLLFLGAVTTGKLQIVTELMETTLRKVMENGRLTPEGISPIAKDVACALNYLHSRPDPIIHRDVSSANVLLSSKQKGWVAKLGDFGSANFLNKTNTKIPGAQLYSAPEAIDPSVGPQGPKMDTYSFGVLLLEMCICQLPEPVVLREAANDVPRWPQPKRSIGELALRCIRPDPDQRPYMAAVVNQL